MNRLMILGAAFSFLMVTGCSKDDTCDCTAYGPDDTALYEVVGSELCNDQVNTEAGEYCNCSCE